VKRNFHYRVHKTTLIVSILSHTNQFHFLPLVFKDSFQYYPPTNFYFFQVNSFLYISPTKPYRYEMRKNYISLNTGIRYVTEGSEITDCMKRTFLRHSQPLSSVKTFPFVFDKAIFQYPVHYSKSLIAMLSPKNTVHIVTTKAVSWRNQLNKSN
jgi:UDP-N-acetylglucosamine pyrophosphorylase